MGKRNNSIYLELGIIVRWSGFFKETNLQFGGKCELQWGGFRQMSVTVSKIVE